MPTTMKEKDERKRVASSIASASAAIRRVRLSSPVKRIVPRQLQQLLVAGVTFVVDADDAVGARTACRRRRRTSGRFPRSRAPARTCESARRTRSGRARRRRCRRPTNGRARPSGPSAPARSVLRIPRRWPAPQPEYPANTAAPDAPGHRVAGDVPDECGLAERSKDAIELRKERMSRTPRFRTVPGDSRTRRSIVGLFRLDEP